MEIKPLSGFVFNDRFPKSGTWRITVRGGGFTGTFTVPAGDQYDLVVTGGSSYDDSRHMPSYSPVTIQVNSRLIVSDYSPTGPNGAATEALPNRWPIFARAGQNTLQFALGRRATTHYWIHKIEIQTAH